MTCIVWGDSCGARGNCWIYDGFKLRAAFNITAAGNQRKLGNLTFK